MHRYAIEGLLRDASVGKRVLLFAAQSGAKETLNQAVVLVEDVSSVYRINRANGCESVEFANGGRLRIISTSHAARGHEADVVYAEGWNDLSERQREDIAYAAIRGELVRS